jgi:PAS domain S-box-containing protein
MPQPLQVLIAEDNEADAELVLLVLEAGGFEVTARVVQDRDGFQAALAEQTWDVVISDYMMPGFGGAEALACLRDTGSAIPFIVVSGTIGEETAVGMMRAGADDYLMKDSLARLPAAVERELALARTRRDQARAVTALRHSEERYRSLFENSPIAVWELDLSAAWSRLQSLSRAEVSDLSARVRRDPEVLRDLVSPAQVTAVNDAAVAMHRAPNREILLQSLDAVMVADSYPVLAEQLAAWAGGATVLDMELPVGTVDGQMRYALVHLFAVPGHEHGMSRVVVTVVDITERRQAEMALADEKERLAVTLASLAECVIATDVTGRVTLMNHAAERLTGWTEREAVGQPLDQVMRLTGGDRGVGPESVWRAVLATGAVLDLPHGTVLESRSGKECAVAASVSPICDVTGEEMGVVLVFRDMSEEQMLRSEALKAQKLESLGVLAGGIAHDFNNVLVVIAGNLQMARVYPRGDERHATLLRSAETACLKARSLAEQLLTFARGGAPIKQVTSLDGLVRDTALFALSGSNVSCQFAIDDDLWAVEADAGQISQVISNLVINADQAMPAGGSLQIALSNVVLPGGTSLPLPAGDYLALSVQDEGTGIAPEYLDRIFDPYFTTKEKGSGLGLASCYSVVRNHGGHIHVTSALGVGSIFTVYLPARRDAAAWEDVRAQEIPGGTGRILVMDDDEDVLEVAVMLLEELGYEVTPVPSGEAAVAAYQEAQQAGAPFVAVMLDLTVRSGLGGKETLERLRELDPEVSAVVCSGYSADPVMAFHTEYGFKGVVVKPYEIADLAKAIRAALRPRERTD